MNRREQLKIDEGLRLRKYRCSEGHWTIGYGWNLENALPGDIASYFRLHGAITEDMAERLLDISIDTATRQCKSVFSDFDQFSERRRDALINMVFNLGVGHFLEFRRMIRAIKAGDWYWAADEAQDSKWFTQVGNRAVRIAKELREG
jgi:lysozyme